MLDFSCHFATKMVTFTVISLIHNDRSRVIYPKNDIGEVYHDLAKKVFIIFYDIVELIFHTLMLLENRFP